MVFYCKKNKVDIYFQFLLKKENLNAIRKNIHHSWAKFSSKTSFILFKDN